MAMRRNAWIALARALSNAAPETSSRNAFSSLSRKGRQGQASTSSAQDSAHSVKQNTLSLQQPLFQAQRRGMFIQMQPTPNPASMMFLPGKTVMQNGSANFASAREAMKSPLARKIFGTDGVKQVFFGSDFVTVTKDDDFRWAVLKPDILAAIADHMASGEPLLLDDAQQAASDTAIHDDDSEVVAMIKELLETRIRPSVQEDGGDIEFRGFDEEIGLVTLKMKGACSGCPSSSITLKSGIENMLQHYIPEVKEVREAEADEYEEVGLAEFSKLESRLSP